MRMTMIITMITVITNIKTIIFKLMLIMINIKMIFSKNLHV